MIQNIVNIDPAICLTIETVVGIKFALNFLEKVNFEFKKLTDFQANVGFFCLDFQNAYRILTLVLPWFITIMNT